MPQKIINGIGYRGEVSRLLEELGAKKPLIVCNYISDKHRLDSILNNAGVSFTYFVDFSSNPLYDEVCKGIASFWRNKCDSIIAIGGGSAIDVAKCIKLFCKMGKDINYLQQEYTDSGIPLIAIPTTAGTGSESTRYAVIYYEGKKQSITHESILPNIVILDAELLQTLPLYQKKCTLLDALCQGIESWWSVNSTGESKEHSKVAVEDIMRNMELYLSDHENIEAAERIMTASNYAGRAINITQTTAPHAMSYKLTSLYRLPHGHAVAICMPKVWRYMLENENKVTDQRGNEYLCTVFQEISKSLGCESPEEVVGWFEKLLRKLEIKSPLGTLAEVEILAGSVNPVRLKNNPVSINEEAFYKLYKQIVMGE